MKQKSQPQHILIFKNEKENLTVHYTHATVVVMHTRNRIEHSSKEHLTPRDASTLGESSASVSRQTCYAKASEHHISKRPPDWLRSISRSGGNSSNSHFLPVAFDREGGREREIPGGHLTTSKYD